MASGTYLRTFRGITRDNLTRVLIASGFPGSHVTDFLVYGNGMEAATYAMREHVVATSPGPSIGRFEIAEETISTGGRPTYNLQLSPRRIALWGGDQCGFEVARTATDDITLNLYIPDNPDGDTLRQKVDAVIMAANIITPDWILNT